GTDRIRLGCDLWIDGCTPRNEKARSHRGASGPFELPELLRAVRAPAGAAAATRRTVPVVVLGALPVVRAGGDNRGLVARSIRRGGASAAATAWRLTRATLAP